MELDLTAQEHNYLLVINQSKYQTELERISVNQFRQMRLAGLMTVSISPDMAYLGRPRAIIPYSRSLKLLVNH